MSDLGEPGVDQLPAATDPIDAAAPGDAADPAVSPAITTARDHGDADLLGLIDRLARLLDRSDLTELEVEVGGTGLVLRKSEAIGGVAGAAAAGPAPVAQTPPEAPTAGHEPAPPARPSVKAPLTGIFYASPAPGSAPYVHAGGEVAVGQVIGLIEAMKLFNEIKSDLAGRVVRVVPDSGTLVKAKQPLIEVEPL
jgi:acetyl-CoA carboxylase biotin carboxyl carrier protein